MLQHDDVLQPEKVRLVLELVEDVDRGDVLLLRDALSQLARHFGVALKSLVQAADTVFRGCLEEACFDCEIVGASLLVELVVCVALYRARERIVRKSVRDALVPCDLKQQLAVLVRESAYWRERCRPKLLSRLRVYSETRDVRSGVERVNKRSFCLIR